MNSTGNHKETLLKFRKNTKKTKLFSNLSRIFRKLILFIKRDYVSLFHTRSLPLENQYMVVKHNIFPLGYLDSNNITSKILDFCGNSTIIETTVLNSTKEAEQFARDQLCE